MNIVSTQYTLKYNALEIYLSGCDGLCDGCHNPELQNYELGTPYQQRINEVVEKIQTFDKLIENIWILGGEPLLQDHKELINMLHNLKSTNKKIWLWTRFDFDSIPKKILNLCDYVKVGNYDKNKKTDDNIQYGIKLATSNQEIIKLGE